MAPSLDKEELNLLKIIFNFAKKRKVKLYLVGGYLRDLILKREKENLDIDFSLKKGAISFGCKLAKEIKAGFVVLDKERGCCRLVKMINDKTYTLDFIDFRGGTLEQDLLGRDFTINALGLELGAVFHDKPLGDLFIDPYHGRRDLKSEVIRMVSGRAFDDDPLRILRAFSLSSIFGFKIDKETLRQIKTKREKLSQASYERIRDELFKILDRPNSFEYIAQLDKLKILKIIFPDFEIMRRVRQGPYHHLDVWEHTLETLRQLDILIQELKNYKEIQDYLNEVISSDRRRRALIKLGALLHDIGKPRAKRRVGGKTKFHGHEKIGLQFTRNIAKLLKLSNDELNSLEKMVFLHLRPGYLADNEEITPRAKFRYFRDAQKEAVSILLLSIADQRATRGRLTSRTTRAHHEQIALGLVKGYFRKQKEKKLVRLVNGDDLIKEFNLKPSPLIGKILAELEELQAIGKIKTKKQALGVARKLIRS
ncbi:MAG: HD domain-containing protein [Candidatus Omnitrophica bacterium]|nr:HD domain-containing protein [Candidatus Omnitrophota bacterium]